MLSSRRRRWLTRNLVKYRRPLAATTAFLAVLTGLSAVRTPANNVINTSGESNSPDEWLAGDVLNGNLVAAPIRFADAAASAVLDEADVVDVIAADGLGGSAVVAAGVEVIALPQVPAASPLSRNDAGALVVLAVTLTQATELAGAAAVGPLSFTLRGPSQ